MFYVAWIGLGLVWEAYAFYLLSGNNVIILNGTISVSAQPYFEIPFIENTIHAKHKNSPSPYGKTTFSF
jgi:hypothetical protein